MKKTIPLLIILALGCKSRDPNFKYVKLKDFKYTEANIEEGTEIQILSFSGGRTCTPETSYYYQFIGINKANGDTVRILTPCQVVDVTSAPPTKGSFTPWSKTSAIIDEALNKTGNENLITEDVVIVFNKQNRDIEERNYKTAIGSLGF